MPLSLVTGGSGFIGRALVKELLRRGERVRVLDVRAPAAEWRDQVEYVQASVTDPLAVRAALAGARRVYHLAAIPDLWVEDKRRFREVNTEGTLRVLEAAREARPERIVHTSTESIIRGLGGGPGHAEVNEATRATIDDMPGPYCRSKFLAERAALDAARDGLPVVVVNPTLPIGPGDDRLTPPTRMLLGYLNGEYPAYLETTFNMVHVRDAARGHILAAEHGVVGQRYILAGENCRLSELLALLHELTGLSMPTRRVPYSVAWLAAAVDELVSDWITHRAPAAPLTGVRLAGRHTSFDNRRVREELGLEITPLRQALGEAVLWLWESGLLRREPARLPVIPAADEGAAA